MSFYHRFVLNDGDVIVVPHHRARRTLDVRDRRQQVETVWEVETDSGLVRRLWPSDLKSWEQEEVK